MRKLLVAALLLLWTMVPAAAQDIEISLAHHTHGVIGTMSTSWVTVVTTDNHVLQILVPANFHMPKDVEVGKAVACAYKVDNQQHNLLVRIKAEDGKKNKEPFVNSVPHI